MTIGEQLREKFFDKQKELYPEKYKKYTEAADKLIATVLTDIDSKISKGELPYTQIPLMAITDDKMVVAGESNEEYLKDDVFHMILQNKAREKGLVLEVQMVKSTDLKNKEKTVQIPILLCTI